VIPKWIGIVCGLITLLGLFVGFSLYVSPGTFIKNVDFSSSNVRFLAQMWAVRQIAIAAIIGFSVFRKSIPMLQISLVAYGLMTLQDTVIGLFRGDMGMVVGSAIGCALAVYMSLRLNRLRTQ
jgi:hypothetical protein